MKTTVQKAANLVVAGAQLYREIAVSALSLLRPNLKLNCKSTIAPTRSRNFKVRQASKRRRMIVGRTAKEHLAIDVIDHAKWGYFVKSALAYHMTGSTAEMSELECNVPPPASPSSNRLLLTGIHGDRPSPAPRRPPDGEVKTYP